MARLARVVIPGLPHHVTQRGNRRADVFFTPEDRRTYLTLLLEQLKRFAVTCHAYCLMDNHVHLILTPETSDGLAQGLGEAHRRYTRHINFREGWRGHLWQGRFFSVPLDPPHTLAAFRYVERNPVRAKLVKTAEAYLWSSAKAHVGGTKHPLVTPHAVQEQIHDWAAFLALAEPSTLLTAFRKQTMTGRPLGDEPFLKRCERVTHRVLHRGKPGPKPEKRDK